MEPLKVYLPAPKSLIAQRFGENANTSYARDGLKGHTAYDWAMLYGAPIPNCVANAYCYSNMHVNDTVLMDYRAAFFLVETETGVYEISYGHLSKHAAIVGKTYQVGETIGYVGNTGDCFVGTHEVTEAEKDAGSHAGAHLHGPQIRPVRKVTKINRTKHYLSDSNGTYQKDGFYYEVINYDNGYNGCVSLAPYSTETLATDYKAPIDLNKVSGIIADSAKAVQEIQTLPAEQQNTWFDKLIGQLLALAKLLK